MLKSLHLPPSQISHLDGANKMDVANLGIRGCKRDQNNPGWIEGQGAKTTEKKGQQTQKPAYQPVLKKKFVISSVPDVNPVPYRLYCISVRTAHEQKNVVS